MVIGVLRGLKGNVVGCGLGVSFLPRDVKFKKELRNLKRNLKMGPKLKGILPVKTK